MMNDITNTDMTGAFYNLIFSFRMISLMLFQLLRTAYVVNKEVEECDETGYNSREVHPMSPNVSTQKAIVRPSPLHGKGV